MNRTRLVLRWLLITLWFAIFIAYLPIWYLQMSWYYFCFQDYWDAFLVLYVSFKTDTDSLQSF